MTTYIIETSQPEKLDEFCTNIGSPKSIQNLFIVESDYSLWDLKKIPGVTFIEEESDDAPDNNYDYDYWHQEISGLTENTNKTGKNVDVYVFDSVVFDHEEFENRLVKLFQSKKGNQENNHGTACSSLVGGKTVGIAPGCIIKHVGYNFKSSETVKGFDILIDDYRKSDKPAVLNMSIFSSSWVYKKLLEKARAEGIIVVVSAGNNGSDKKQIPARLDTTLAVAAHDRRFKPTDFTSYGEDVDIWAAGSSMKAANIEGSYRQFNGTSAAAPIVSGAFALLLEGSDKLTSKNQTNDVINYFFEEFTRENDNLSKPETTKKVLNIPEKIKSFVYNKPTSDAKNKNNSKKKSKIVLGVLFAVLVYGIFLINR